MCTLYSKLDVLLENIDIEHPEQHNETDIVISNFHKANDELKKAQQNLELAANKLCGELALKIRTHLSGLNINLNKYGCTIGYRHKTLTFKPNLLNNVWVVTGNHSQFVQNFMAKYSPLMSIQNVDKISQAIAEYFKNYYRSLNEEINGNGLILLEGINKSTSDIAMWKSSLTFKLKRVTNGR